LRHPGRITDRPSRTFLAALSVRDRTRADVHNFRNSCNQGSVTCSTAEARSNTFYFTVDFDGEGAVKALNATGLHIKVTTLTKRAFEVTVPAVRPLNTGTPEGQCATMSLPVFNFLSFPFPAPQFTIAIVLPEVCHHDIPRNSYTCCPRYGPAGCRRHDAGRTIREARR
jgi:hypothetical protein